MRASIAIAAAVIGAVNAAPEHYGYGGGYESVVYSTSTPAPYKVYTSEAPAYTPAPAPYKSPAPVYSAPAYSAPAPAYSAPAYSAPAPVYSAPPAPPAYNNATGVPYITKTVYTTSLYTVTSCAAYVTDCPARSTLTYTSVVPAYTTVCPATETETYPTATPNVPASSVVAPTVVVPSPPCTKSSTVTVVVPVSTGAVGPSGYKPYPSGGSSAIWGTASSSGYLKPSATQPAEYTGAASHANVGAAVVGLGAFAALFL